MKFNIIHPVLFWADKTADNLVHNVNPLSGLPFFTVPFPSIFKKNKLNNFMIAEPELINYIFIFISE